MQRSFDLDDDFVARFMARSGEVVGDGDDDAPEPNIVKRKRRPLIFRERDIKRAIAGHMKAGLSVKRTEIDASGRIVIVTGQPEQTSITPENEWDAVQ